MNPSLRIVSTTAVCILGALLSACATAPGDAPPFSVAPAAPEGYGTVYLYRLGAGPPLRKPDVLVAKNVIHEPPEATYTWMHVKAGDRSFFLQWPFELEMKSDVLYSTIAAGESYYIKISGSWHTGFGNKTVMNSRMDLIPAANATAELSKCCKYIPAQVARID